MTENRFNHITIDEDERRLISAALDTAEKSNRGQVATSGFLTLREQKLVKSALLSAKDSYFSFYGGFDSAERRILVCFPEHVSYEMYLQSGYTDMMSAEAIQLFETYFAEHISFVKISCSKFDKIAHRDTMGSILALGVNRAALGDIILEDDKTAYVAATPKMCELIKSELKSVGRSAVKVENANRHECASLTFKSSTFDTISSSLRFDCVVSAITGISREKSKALISSSQAELNSYNKARPDDDIADGDVISVRGYGKYRIHLSGNMTQKGKYRLIVYKYI